MIKPTVNANGEICIDFLDVMYEISDSAKVEMIERLSCEDAIIKHVSDQIHYGCTENGYSGSESINNLMLGSELQSAREDARKKGNRLLLAEIKRLRAVLENRNKYQESGWNEYHKLYSKVYGKESY